MGIVMNDSRGGVEKGSKRSVASVAIAVGGGCAMLVGVLTYIFIAPSRDLRVRKVDRQEMERAETMPESPPESPVGANPGSLNITIPDENGLVIVNGNVIGGNLTKGSGRVTTETRPVGDFTAVEVNTSADVTLTAVGKPSLVLEGDDNILPLVTTDVNNGTLVLSAKGNYSTKNPIRVRLTTAAINALTINGSGDARLDSVTGEELNLVIQGSGDITAAGRVNRLAAVIGGSGNIRAKELVAGNCQVMVNGSGDAEVFATTGITAEVNGSGNIVYYGSPKIDVSVRSNGSGSIRSGK
ncbi:MAG: head GIN domain-containing protein [Planctomycetota bacterium]